MARELKNVAASVRARLQNLAREQQANFQRVLTRYALERFLFRLSVSPHRQLFVLKGAMLYAAWLEDPFRTTRDLDLLSLADREAMPLLETIRDVCAQPVADDGLRFDTENILAEPFGEDRTHGALRVRTSAELGAAVIPVQIDVGFGDAVTPGPLELEYPVLLDQPTPTLYERALGEPGFVADVKRGGSPELDAADRMLRFMDIAPIGPRFRHEVEAFLIAARVRTRATALGTKAVRKSSFVRDLINGASPTLDIVERVRSWMHGFADEFERTGIAWLLASNVTVPPYGLPAAFPPWTGDDEGIGKLDERTFLTAHEAAPFLGVSIQTLKHYRVTGGGPAFHKFGGRVLYARFDLEAWAKMRPRRSPWRALSDGARPSS